MNWDWQGSGNVIPHRQEYTGMNYPGQPERFIMNSGPHRVVKAAWILCAVIIIGNV